VGMLYIFDMGGVLAYNTDVFPDVFGFLGITGEQFSNLAGNDLERFLNGEITTDEFWSSFSIRYGKKVNEELFGKFFSPRLDQDVMEIIKQLKNHSRVVCGTNTFDPHYDYLLERGYYDVFDAVFASNKMGVSKPDPDFYRFILNNEGIKPEDALFVDDSEINVSAAKNLQIRSILFTDSHSLAHHIKRLQASGLKPR
jgi:epoxide hydrolase-like predicted phosphatase